jgi:hypothetical protein
MRFAIDLPDRRALEERWRKLRTDPARLRATLGAALLALGLVAIEGPQALRLCLAHRRLAQAEQRAELADDVRALEQSSAVYGPRLATGADADDWRAYITEKLEKSGARARSIEPKTSSSAGPFALVAIDLSAQGTYAEITDLVDRLERGERLVRIDHIFVQRLRDTVDLQCTLRALVRAAKPDARSEPPHG